MLDRTAGMGMDGDVNTFINIIMLYGGAGRILFYFKPTFYRNVDAAMTIQLIYK